MDVAAGLRLTVHVQILDSSDFGLRSARLVLRSLTSKVSITLFPMIHLGEPAFFEAVYADAFAHDAVMVEGVRSPITKRVTRAYRWIMGAKQIALVVQPPYPSQAQSRAKIIHADLSGAEFEKLWAEVSIFLKVLVYLGAPVYAVYQRWFGTRASLAKGHTLDDLPSRKETMNWTPEFAAFDNAIMVERDKRLLAVLRSYLDEPSEEPRRLAIVYGAAHMRAVIREVTKHLGYYAAESDWMLIFSLDREEAPELSSGAG